MRIDRAQVQVLESENIKNQKIENDQQALEKETESPSKDAGVLVSISEQGKGYYENSLRNVVAEKETTEYAAQKTQYTNPNTQPIDDISVINSKAHIWTTPASDEFYTLAVAENRFKTTPSPEEAANHIYSAYAKTYNDIVEGYKNGTRNVLVEDDTTEKGYRSMTQDEEITELNKSYNKLANGLGEELESAIFGIKALYKSALENTDLRGYGGKEKAAALKPIYDRVKNYIIPKDYSEKLTGAIALFRQQYQVAASENKDMNKFVENAKIYDIPAKQ